MKLKRIFKVNMLLAGIFHTSCNNFERNCKMNIDLKPVNWISKVNSGNSFFDERITSHVNNSPENCKGNFGLHRFKDSLMFNTSGAIKIPGFANANMTCKMTSLFFALLTELYIELSSSNYDFLNKFEELYSEKIEWVKKFESDNYVKSWKKQKVDSATKEMLLYSVEKIVEYGNDEEKKIKLLKEVEIVTENIVKDLMPIMEFRMKDFGDYIEKEDEKNDQALEEVEKNYPFIKFSDVNSDISKYVACRVKEKNDPKYDRKFAENWRKRLYSDLNFLNPITYKAIENIEKSEKREPYYNVPDSYRELLTSLYFYRFLVQPFILEEEYCSFSFEKEEYEIEKEKNINLLLEETNLTNEKTSCTYKILNQQIEKLKILFYIFLLEYSLEELYLQGHYISKLLPQRQISDIEALEIGDLFSKIIGYEYGTEKHIFTHGFNFEEFPSGSLNFCL